MKSQETDEVIGCVGYSLTEAHWVSLGGRLDVLATLAMSFAGGTVDLNSSLPPLMTSPSASGRLASMAQDVTKLNGDQAESPPRHMGIQTASCRGSGTVSRYRTQDRGTIGPCSHGCPQGHMLSAPLC